MRIRRCSLIAIVVLAAAGTAFAADSPWAGKWKMDASQSKLTGNTIQISSMGDELVYTAQGHTTKYKLGGGPTKTWAGDETSWKKIDNSTYESHATANGVDLGTDTWTVSPDGKSLKLESKGTNPDGSSFNDAVEYARVGGTQGLTGSWKSTKANLNENRMYDIADKGPDELTWNIPEIKGVLDIKLDGKDYAPVGPTVPKGLTIALTKAGPHTLKMVEKMNGTVTYHSTMTVSADGKKMTEVGTPAKTTETFTSVWIKQ
jgi:hypothetical protein